MPRPVHFEIHASEPEKSIKFYSSVFGWEFSQWDNSDTDYWLIKTGEEGEPGINGGLIKRKGPRPEPKMPLNAFPFTVDVPDIDEYVKKIQDNGGIIVLEKMPIPTVGWVAYCVDPDRNLLGIMQEDQSAK